MQCTSIYTTSFVRNDQMAGSHGASTFHTVYNTDGIDLKQVRLNSKIFHPVPLTSNNPTAGQLNLQRSIYNGHPYLKTIHTTQKIVQAVELIWYIGLQNVNVCWPVVVQLFYFFTAVDDRDTIIMGLAVMETNLEQFQQRVMELRTNL